jgi:hypothetical protein
VGSAGGRRRSGSKIRDRHFSCRRHEFRVPRV